jgi:tRNA(Ile)-lysidine synthase
MRRKLLEKTRRTIQKYHLISQGSRWIVAVSGGADSLALLHILYTLQNTLGCRLHVATLDHGLRGDAGAADATFVVQLAEAWGVPVTVGKVDTLTLAKRKQIGVEAAARIARYNFLAEVADRVGAEGVAIGHHAGDQAETVLMHILRGAGLNGLGGMSLKSPMPGHPHLVLIRPLLWSTRAEIETYCRERKLTPREDATNADTSFLRNYLRHKILPHLANLNPNIERLLGQLADIAQVEDDYLNHQLRQVTQSDAVRVGIKRITIRREVFRSLHPALARRVVRWGTAQINPHLENLDYAHILDAVEIGREGGQGAIALLADGLRLRVDYEMLLIEHESEPMPEWDDVLLPQDSEFILTVPGQTVVPGSEWILNADESNDDSSVHAGRLAIPEGAAVCLRTRREGDRFAPLGMDGHAQKLNRWMINRKIPVYLRGRIPIIDVDGEIAAIYVNGVWFVADKYAVRPHHERIIYFDFRKHS